MSRIPRKYLETSFFHVMLQGINKEYIFKNERYINMYLKLIKKYINPNIKIIAFCVMSNHIHLLVKIKSIDELSEFMHNVNGYYAKYYNYMENGRVGYVFRDRYKCEIIKDRTHLRDCVRYIHQNPVKAKMVKNENEYKYSSFNFYLDKTRKKDEIFTEDDIKYICNSNNDYDVDFLDIDKKDEKSIFYNAVSQFLKQENIKVFEIFENSDILKKLIKYLKQQKNIKYTVIMKELEITKGTMERLKK